MNKFWKWMKKEYNYKESNIFIYICDCDDFIEIPKQMLIGYMLEYIRVHRKWEQEYLREAPAIYNKLANLWIKKNIYQQLEDIIKLIDKENK